MTHLALELLIFTLMAQMCTKSKNGAIGIGHIALAMVLPRVSSTSEYEKVGLGCAGITDGPLHIMQLHVCLPSFAVAEHHPATMNAI